MFTFENAEFRYEAYPIGVIAPIMVGGLYEDLVDSFPPVELFDYMPKVGHKYTLSEKFKSSNYHDYIAKMPAWRDGVGCPTPGVGFRIPVARRSIER